MRPFILLVTVTFLVCSCGEKGQGKVQPADTLRTDLSSTEYVGTTSKGDKDTINKTGLALDTLPNISFGKMTLVSSGQMSPYTEIKIDGCDFNLVTSDSDTTYLATHDKRFQTPEGYKVGIEFLELPKDIQGHLTKEPGWGYYYKLPSGWTLGFCEGNSCTDKYPENGSKVKWIFKRR
jgi:hypothetical protein